MTKGNRDREMLPCNEVLARLWEFLDDELGPADEARMKEHLDICGRCFPQYDFQRAYFEYTRRIRDRDYAPAELRRRIFQRILEEEATVEG